MADRACLTGYTAAVNAANDIELAGRFSKVEGLTNDELKGFKTEIIVYISVIDRDLARAGVYANARNGALSSSRAVEIRIRFVPNS